MLDPVFGGKFKDLTGKRFGRWTVMYPTTERNSSGARLWHCKCDCGNEKDVTTYNLKSGISSSCGCLRYERAAAASRKDLTGQTFGRLTALYPTDKRDFYNVIWHCKCECGREVDVSSNRLTMKNTQSCGMCGLQQQRASEANTKYGSDLERKLERVFHGMKSRCYNPNSLEYHNYGGRGIRICDEWLEDVNKFIKWALSHGWKPGLQIDRHPNRNGNYEPGNCRCVTSEDNNNNKRNNKFVKIDDMELTCSRWDRYLGLPQSTMCHYLKDHGREKTEQYIKERLARR